MTNKRTGMAALIPLLVAVVLPLSHDRSKLEPVATGQKPMFPVLATLSLVNRPEAGGVARLMATVTAWAPGEAVEWRLEAPAAMTWIDGPTTWSGTLAAGETVSFEIALGVPDDLRRDVTVRAWLPERPRATSAASAPIDLGALDGLRATASSVTADGETYIQYQGEVTPSEVPR